MADQTLFLKKKQKPAGTIYLWLKLSLYSVILMGYHFSPIFAKEFKCQFKPIEIR
jgi:hypothetical protein